MIIASAVIVTGRIRVNPAASADSIAFFPVARSSLANVTSRMLFAVATPMPMIAPISAGTLRVVPVRYSIHSMPAMRSRQRHQDDERIQPGLKIDGHDQVDQHHREDHPQAQPREGRPHGVHLTAQVDRGSARKRRAHLGDDLLDVRGETAQIALVRTRENVDNRLNIVVAFDLRRVVPFQSRQIVEQLRLSRPRAA